MVQAADSGAREPRREPNTAPHATMSQCPAYKSQGVSPDIAPHSTMSQCPAYKSRGVSPDIAPHSTMSQCPAYKSRGVGPTLPLTPLCLSALPIKGDPPHWFAVKAKEADPSIKPSD